MKIKNSNENLRLGMLVPVACASVSVFSILRCFQTVRYIDSETGFFVGGDWLKFLLYALIACACLFFSVVSFLSADSKKVELVYFKDKFAGMASIAFAVSLFYDCFDSFYESLMIFDNLYVIDIENSKTVFKTLMASGTLPYFLQSLFAVLSAFYIIVVAKNFLKGSGSAHNHKLLALAPIAWSGFKMITRFVKQISYIRVSDLFLELIMLAFAITFFVALSQVISGVYCDESRWRITALGFSAGVIALSVNISRFVLTVFASDFVNAEYPFSIADAMLGLFAFAVAMAAVKSVQASKKQVADKKV